MNVFVNKASLINKSYIFFQNIAIRHAMFKMILF